MSGEWERERERETESMEFVFEGVTTEIDFSMEKSQISTYLLFTYDFSEKKR